MSKRPLDDAPRITITSVHDLRDWLADNHDSGTGHWLVTWKKGDARHVPYADVVDHLLCFGWVDSLPRGLSDRQSMLYISPRKPRSNWYFWWTLLKQSRVG